ncbi:hypothetical protein CK203_088702 [Vitis vinifera]|uniref:Uncharacterized protein n=1 Tax=Vitis vinifera TaxID=29760 RepID=A0A438D487_VITVI|nr:hypothetical protein CK203_088702 [Vitis vinifera]
MSLVETSSIDCVHQRLDRLSSKRKLDDYSSPADDDFSDLVSFRMRKFDQNAFVSCNSPPDSHLERHRVVDARSCPSSCSAESARPDSRLQFFVRMISEGNTLVIHGEFG